MRNRAITAALAVASGLAVTVAGVSLAQAAELKVMASNAVKTALEELGPQFEKSTSHKLAFTFKAAAELKAEIEKGAAVDVAILTAGGIDDLVKQGKITAASRTDVVGSSIGLAVRKGAPKPDISTADAFKKTLLAAKSIGFVEQGATGIYLKQLFAKLGVTEAVAGKLVSLPSTNPAAKAVGNGEAEIGMTQISEILPYPTADLVGPLPAEVQQVTLFSGGIAAASKEADAAKAFVAFLKSPAAAPVMKAKGLDPK